MNNFILRIVASTIICIGIVTPAAAWDGSPTGSPGILEVSTTDFIIYYEAQVPMCGNTTTWAYVSTTDATYQTTVALIMLAKSLGKTITVYSTRTPGGSCHIGYVAMSS